jgi:biopolymer transport protein ExbB/TolQ
MEPVQLPPDSELVLDGQRRAWRRAFVVGIILCCGPTLGILGTIAGMLLSYDRIETLRAPTPGDLAVGVHWSMWSVAIGGAAALIGVPLALWSHVKLNRIRKREDVSLLT